MRLSLFAPLEGLIAPIPSPDRVAFLTAQPFAHRGLHDGIARIENSRAAFRAAIAAGHGIELDVQSALGGEPFVFHDADLERLTRVHGRLVSRPARELDAIRLAGSDEMLPRLGEILALIAGRVPVLIEIKVQGGHIGPLCLSVRRALEGYRGDVAVMSFDDRVPRWFGAHYPRIVRGLIVSESDEITRFERLRGSARRLLAMTRSRPDFLAYDVRSLPSRFAAAMRARGIPLLTWTVRDATSEAIALAHADEVIYEIPQ